MEAISVLDMFKVGVGPSSSHTLGPWRAARRFIRSIDCDIDQIKVELYGSLALTGKGHGTITAIIMGLMDHDPETVDLQLVKEAEQQSISLQSGGREILLHPEKDIKLFRGKKLPFHTNGMVFRGYLRDTEVISQTYYSIGGGFIVKEGETAELREMPDAYCHTAENLLQTCENLGLSISSLVYQNELAWHDEEYLEARLRLIWDTMVISVFNGIHTGGVLPGGLSVKRRASEMFHKLMGTISYNTPEEMLMALAKEKPNFEKMLKWIGCFALAVNEENASFGRIVTAPTNGASGVIPAVLMYYNCFYLKGFDWEKTKKFLLTASEIGSLFKRHATISAAMGGCQAEIGVSSAMSAAALAEGMGGSIGQVLMAAEIAMEHHLGLTCDPIAGLVQVPCIERNSMGAIKAITAAQIALDSDPKDAKVSLDGVIQTMWDTAKDMKSKYKETSKGGLAVNVSVKVPEC